MADSIVEQLLRTKQIDKQDAFNYANVAAWINQNHRSEHVGRRMDAQVDALLRAKYQPCEGEGEPLYQPPDEEESMSHTFINTSINGDAAIAQLTKILEGECPETDIPAPPTQPSLPPIQIAPTWWKRLLMFAIPLLLGALLTWVGYWLFNGGSEYEIIAIDQYRNGS